MRPGSALLTALASCALLGCGGDGDSERPRDFRTAADDVCLEHNEQIEKLREKVAGRSFSPDELADNINAEAGVMEDQLKELRALRPPPEADAYLDRLERNVMGYRRAADDLATDGGASFETFVNRSFNSGNAARREAESLGLEQCSPAPLN